MSNVNETKKLIDRIREALAADGIQEATAVKVNLSGEGVSEEFVVTDESDRRVQQVIPNGVSVSVLKVQSASSGRQ